MSASIEDGDRIEDDAIPIIIPEEVQSKIELSMTCPLSQEVFNDPVVLVESAITYNRHMLLQWLAEHNTCPVTRKVLTSKAIVPNTVVKSMTEDFYRMGLISKAPAPIPPAPTPVGRVDSLHFTPNEGAASMASIVHSARQAYAPGASPSIDAFAATLRHPTPGEQSQAEVERLAGDLAQVDIAGSAAPETLSGLSIFIPRVPQSGYAAWRSTVVGEIIVPQDFHPQGCHVRLSFEGVFDPSYIDQSYGNIKVGGIEMSTPASHVNRQASGSKTFVGVNWLPGSSQVVQVDQYVGGWESLYVTIAVQYTPAATHQGDAAQYAASAPQLGFAAAANNDQAETWVPGGSEEEDSDELSEDSDDSWTEADSDDA